MRKSPFTIKMLLMALLISLNVQLLPTSASATDSVIAADSFYPQVKELTYDYVLEKNKFTYTAKIKIRYHRNPASFLQLIYVTPVRDAGCPLRSFAPTTFDFGLSENEIGSNVFSSALGLNVTSLTSRVRDGDWFLDEYTAKATESDYFSQSYFDLVSKCGPRELSGVMVYDISGKAVIIDQLDQQYYQSNMNRVLPPSLGSATFDSEQSGCSPIQIKDDTRTHIYRLACNHNINFANYRLSYTNPPNSSYSISAKAKAAADLKAKQEADARAAADLKAKQEVEAKAAEELRTKQEAASKASGVKKTSITCIKGKLAKKVVGVKPKCPSGYKKK
jgi:hypothetical protein